MVTIFHIQDVDYCKTIYNVIEKIDYWFTARNFCYDEGLANFAEVCGTKIKVDLQYTINIHVYEYKFNVQVLKI